jgi:precorrin-2/cobalt-factor-2 C20-methyltransferase
VPANYGTSDLCDVLRAFDTVVLMKIGSEMPRVIAALEATQLIDKAVYVSKASMSEQHIERDLRLVARTHGDCFAMVVVAKKEASGVLLGEVPEIARGALNPVGPALRDEAP